MFERKYFSSSSLWLVVLLFVALVTFRSSNIQEKEISWDVFGYYLPIIATFQFDDPLMKDRSWVEELNAEKKLTGTVYQLSTTDSGEPMYFFLFGMSYFYVLFYFIGDWIAGFMGYAQDGFSAPYTIALVYGCMIYTLIGLIYLRKILRHFFSETITVWVLILIVLGTNYAHHMSIKNLETVNVLFFLATIVIWNTIQWHINQKFKHLLAIAIGSVLMALVKPSEILFLLLPIMWNVWNKESAIDKLNSIWQRKFQFLIVIVVACVIAFPQLYYWYLKTGFWIFDTYKNPGVGLDILSPHIFDSLFSYKKGWLLYTPVMVFALIGIYYFQRRNKRIFLAVFLTILVSAYIVFSWTEWWYGAGFSNRPMITYYPLLSICLGYFLVELLQWKKTMQTVIFVVFTFFIFLNQFQWWQLRVYILDPYRTTKAYYWASFLHTSVTPEQRGLLSFKRDFSAEARFVPVENVFTKRVVWNQFSDVNDGHHLSPESEEFGFNFRKAYKELTKKDHVWVKVTFDYLSDNLGEPILVAAAMIRSNGAYGYQTFELKNDTSRWQKMEFYYLTPEIRSINDQLNIDFWKRNPCNLRMDNLKIDLYETK